MKRYGDMWDDDEYPDLEDIQKRTDGATSALKELADHWGNLWD